MSTHYLLLSPAFPFSIFNSLHSFASHFFVASSSIFLHFLFTHSSSPFFLIIFHTALTELPLFHSLLPFLLLFFPAFLLSWVLFFIPPPFSLFQTFVLPAFLLSFLPLIYLSFLPSFILSFTPFLLLAPPGSLSLCFLPLFSPSLFHSFFLSLSLFLFTHLSSLPFLHPPHLSFHVSFILRFLLSLPPLPFFLHCRLFLISLLDKQLVRQGRNKNKKPPNVIKSVAVKRS